MKKLLFYSILILSLFLLSTKFSSIQAQTDDESVEAGITASSPFYFLDKLGERIQLAFALDNLKKSELNLQFAEERLAEVDKLMSQNKTQKIAQTLSRYQNQIQNAYEHANKSKEEGKENNKSEEVLKKVAEATMKHQGELSEIYEQAPEEAKEGIENAMNSSMKGHDNAYNALSNQSKDEVDSETEEIKEDLNNKRNQGVPVPDIPSNSKKSNPNPGQDVSPNRPD